MHEANTDQTARRKTKCIFLGGDLDTPVPATGNSSRQSITEDITEFSTTMKQLYLTNKYLLKSNLCLIGFPGDTVVKNLPAMQEMQETQVQSQNSEDPLE